MTEAAGSFKILSVFIVSQDAAVLNTAVLNNAVLTAVLMIIQVPHDVTLCHWMYSSWGSEGLYCVTPGS